jgi:rSAM/selenodomain-associated transferase 1
VSKNSLIIFTRKPELGKVKTRLAKGVGDIKALEVYIHLLKHSAEISSQVDAEKQVWYTNSIEKNDVWSDKTFKKYTQVDGDLGDKMKHAFFTNFKNEFEKVVIMGTDLLDIYSNVIENAFEHLDDHDVVIGPAEDGGYYLLGMNHFIPEVFEDVEWSTSKVLDQTLNKLKHKSVMLLDEKNDIDYKEDALRHAELKDILSQDSN